METITPFCLAPIHCLVLLLTAGIPIGVPPLPPDPAISAVAPEECWAYFSLAGMATPDANNANQAEQLLAEPEVQRMAAEIEKIISEAVGQNASRNLPPGIAVDDLTDIAKMLLTRPAAVYVSSLSTVSGNGEFRGGAIVHCGKSLEKMKSFLDAVIKLIPPPMIETVRINDRPWRKVTLPPMKGLKKGGVVSWGFKDKYFLLAVGQNEAEAMLKRLDANQPPAWLVKAKQDAAIERISTVSYVNAKKFNAFIATLSASDEKTAEIVKAIGLDGIASSVSVTGLDAKGGVCKTFLNFDGPLQGLMRLGDVKPLAKTDLATVPADATFALAFKLNPENALDALLSIVEKAEPRAKKEVMQGIGRMESRLGVKLREDMLTPLGDTWRVFDSPGEGGALTGVTLVASLKKPAKAAETISQLVDLFNADMGSSQANPSIKSFDFSGRKIYEMKVGVWGPPVAFSWCVTDKELVVSLYPQSIKAYLSRGKDFRSLAELPEVAAMFQGTTCPVKMTYCNTQRVFDVVYPFLPGVMTVISQDVLPGDVDLRTSLLPSARAIRPHLSPCIVGVNRTKSGFEIIEHRTLPGPGISVLSSSAATGLSAMVNAQRSATRRMASTNNLKQIGLAMHNYGAAYKNFPPAYSVDKNSKPLLSWRVLILPFIECDALYKEFHLDEPWDSPHNKKLLSKMPAVYKSPASKVAGEWKTNYLTVRGEDTMFNGSESATFASARDGLSNTILTVEVADDSAIEWTKPDDFEYDPKNPKEGLFGLWPGGTNVGFGDASVRFISQSLSNEVLNALFTRNGGEAVNIEANRVEK